MASSIDRGVLTALHRINETALATPAADAALDAVLDACRSAFPDAASVAATPSRVASHPWKARFRDQANQTSTSFRPSVAAVDI